MPNLSIDFVSSLVRNPTYSRFRPTNSKSSSETTISSSATSGGRLGGRMTLFFFPINLRPKRSKIDAKRYETTQICRRCKRKESLRRKKDSSSLRHENIQKTKLYHESKINIQKKVSRNTGRLATQLVVAAKGRRVC